MRDLAADLDARRCEMQARLDAQKSPTERNRLGQFATPPPLARGVVSFALRRLPVDEPIRFLDPAVGTGAFYAALLASAGMREVQWARGFELDAHYGVPATDLWAGTPLRLTLGDFTGQAAPAQQSELANLLICNPPYVRHHHLAAAEKLRLQAAARRAANVDLSGLAGLYCYFMALAHPWMSAGAVAGWLIPSEFMDVNYGSGLKTYLLREVTLLHIHRFDPAEVQFDDALVSSAVVWLKNSRPPVGHRVVFSYGGSISRSATERSVALRDLLPGDKWSRYPAQPPVAATRGLRLGDLFAVKRGLATGDNGFFIVDEQTADRLELPARFLRPILPSSRYIQSNEIAADARGLPALDRRLFLIDCDLPEEQLAVQEPALWRYLQAGLERVASRYLCRSRRPWYAQERRPAAPIVCTYIGRSDHAGRPFRFLLNQSRATATNVYLMLYPQPLLARHLAESPGSLRTIWQSLNAIRRETLLGSGRVYGGGMHKLEPKELANVPVDELAALAGLIANPRQEQLVMAELMAD